MALFAASSETTSNTAAFASRIQMRPGCSLRLFVMGNASAGGDFEVEFYEGGGRKPIETFLSDLDATKRLAMIAAIEQVLAKQGIGVCKSSWGKMLGGGLFEFRVRHTAAEIRHMFGGDPPAGPADKEGPPGKILLRAFCHAYGDRIILLLGGYDKGESPSSKRQQKEIETARKRLKAFQSAQKQAAKRKALVRVAVRKKRVDAAIGFGL